MTKKELQILSSFKKKSEFSDFLYITIILGQPGQNYGENVEHNWIKVVTFDIFPEILVNFEWSGVLFKFLISYKAVVIFLNVAKKKWIVSQKF